MISLDMMLDASIIFGDIFANFVWFFCNSFWHSWFWECYDSIPL